MRKVFYMKRIKFDRYLDKEGCYHCIKDDLIHELITHVAFENSREEISGRNNRKKLKSRDVASNKALQLLWKVNYMGFKQKFYDSYSPKETQKWLHPYKGFYKQLNKEKKEFRKLN